MSDAPYLGASMAHYDETERPIWMRLWDVTREQAAEIVALAPKTERERDE